MYHSFLLTTLFQDLGVVEDTDPGLMLLAFKLGAEAQWEFSREEFINGWTAFGCVLLL